MEKLQAALEKARDKRNETGRAGGAGPMAARASNMDSEAWEKLTPLPMDGRRLQKKRVVALESSPDATPFDILRTKILQLMSANGWHRLAITSPGPGSGKTTTAANLAASLGRQQEMRTILMDMDMRRPSLAKVFEHTGAHNVFDVLEGKVSFGEQALRLGDNVALSLNYKHARDPSELFLRQRTSEIIDEIEKTYKPGIMLFDMPPMLANDDTTAFLPNVDCALVVAEAEGSPIKQIDLCERELADQTNVLGVVLNKCRFQDDSYGYQYNYY